MEKERLFRNLERKYCSKCELTVNIPLGVDTDEIWQEILQNRRSKGVRLPLKNICGEAYWYLLTNKMISASEVIVDELMERDTAQQPHRSSVATIEEIYFTGFMEGAQISVQDAMNFLQSGDEPSSVEELILLNNRQAAGFAAENMYHAIDSDYLHNLAYFLTEGLDNGSGDFRITDYIEIPSLQGEIVRLPPAEVIPNLVEQFSVFLADTKTHPLIKSAVAQAWILAVRPFPEGNERLARLLSSVILIRAGYSFFGEVSISATIAKSSYEYFRAIANILRTENGADLTYFLEYYLIVLSAAVNNLRARRMKGEQDTITEEQKMAITPLSGVEECTPAKKNEPPNHTDAPSEDSEGTFIVSQRSKYQVIISAALEQLESQGCVQFTSKDIMELTGIERKSATRILNIFEKCRRITAISRGTSGNIYAFKEKADSSTCSDNISSETESDNDMEQGEYEHFLTEMIQDRLRVGSDNSALVSETLRSFYEHSRYQFTSNEISEESGVPLPGVRNTLAWFKSKGVIKVIAEVHKTFTYAFAVKISQDTNIAEVNRGEQFVSMLHELEQSDDEKVKLFAEVFQRYYEHGKTSFTTAELINESGLKNYEVHNGLRPFRVKGLIENININGLQGYYRMMTDISEETDTSCEDANGYSDEVLILISQLADSKGSQKDRRIGNMLKSCLKKGIITKRDYIRNGSETAWASDMSFASQLGLTKAVSKTEYKILHNLDEYSKPLLESQKNALKALYDIFGDDAFSSEMVIAQLDYSSAQASGILHQFTWMKILGCKKGNNNKMSYQFIVNPTDNPEYFETVA
jgi:transcription initiation factor IIE alpha subunit